MSAFNNQFKHQYLIMTNTYLDDFMDKMITVPNDINRFLRLIRKLDKRVEDIQLTLIPQQNKFLAQVKQLKEKKIAELPPAMKAEFEIIKNKQKQVVGYSKEKKQVSDQLYYEVAEYQKMLQTQLRNKYKDKPQDQFMRRKKLKLEANKIILPVKKEQFYYDNKEPQYCYCGRSSFGEMVLCQNPYCQREWFHTDCILQKNLPQKWYCMDCQKQRQNIKNQISKSYLLNKDSNSAS